MEFSGKIFFENRKSSEELNQAAVELCQKYRISVESIRYVSTFSQFSFWGGPDASDSIKQIVKELSGNCAVTKAYLIDDEDGGCELLSGNSGKVESNHCDAEIYDYISDMDEERINESDELKEVSQNPPRKLFESWFSRWSVGLENVSLNIVRRRIEDMITEAESYCQ